MVTALAFSLHQDCHCTRIVTALVTAAVTVTAGSHKLRLPHMLCSCIGPSAANKKIVIVQLAAMHYAPKDAFICIVVNRHLRCLHKVL